MDQTVQELFSQVFQPKEQFPRWFQPTKDIGAILVQNQAEEDALRARDWTPKPLPGTEAPAASLTTEQEVDALRAQVAAMAAQMAALLASTGRPTASTTAPATDVPGALSDAAEDHS